MSEIYQNAVDSLRISTEYFLKEPNYSSRKHSILTLFHSIELLLKEQLYRISPILIYRNIDAKIKADSQTVGIKEALTRLENLGLGLPDDTQTIIEDLQKRRNRIEHHRYDHKEEDENTIAKALQFILFFADAVLREKLETDIPAEALREVQNIVYENQQRYFLAISRTEAWMHETWPSWNEYEADTPEEFEGTVDCPICRESYLVMDNFELPFCFYCNTSVEAAECENCGCTYLVENECSCAIYQ